MYLKSQLFLVNRIWGSICFVVIGDVISSTMAKCLL